ncbi:MAG: membrane protease YdiL (CAAX protease family) [Planctomycetota bacterium]|jgi:membrane protease YdiL (CAAX protease family)
MSSNRCPGCKARLDRKKRFCANCGYRIQDRVEHTTQRAVLAILCIFGGVLAVLSFGALWQPLEYSTASTFLRDQLLMTLGVAGCAVPALILLGGGSWKASFGGSCTWKDLGLGVLVGLACFLASFVYVELLLLLAGEEEMEIAELVGFEASYGVLWIAMVLLPALSEEWTDRGVLWIALRRVTGPGATVFCTALLFAFMHGLNGGGLFEAPHRFLVGLGLGWLRLRSGSLWPGILAHGVLNTLAISI